MNTLRKVVRGCSSSHGLPNKQNLSNLSTDSFFYNDKYDNGESRFGKVLIANRGEIACRVMTTCRRLGIKTVAVFSEVDVDSLFVHMADEAVCIGPPLSVHSYLNMDALLNAVKKTGAEAVHPGYGFLSENHIFAKRLSDMGVTFVGPNPEAIRTLGDKIESKRIAARAGIKCIDGFDGDIVDPAEALRIAKNLGYPVVVKASAAGGGKGIRVAQSDRELLQALQHSKDEAQASFGDRRVLLERYLFDPRHVEVQILCDTHGNVLHLHERDCSIQRRNQKLIEEAPSPLLVNSATLCRIFDQAVALARAINYDSAGTVEFLFDDQTQEFYFLEMNTRLQVEHTITECITGVDIVHQMLRVAKGHRLLYRQGDISVRGCAVECRVSAEDPSKALGLPSIGQITSYHEPSRIDGVRCDSGVMVGSKISLFYDPLVCKLIAHGKDRKSALNIMTKALDSFVIRGVTNNIPLLRDIIGGSSFVSGEFTTSHLARIYPNGFGGAQLSEEEVDQLAALATVIHVKAALRNYANGSKTIRAPFEFVVSTNDGKIMTNARVIRREHFFEVSLEGSSLPQRRRVVDVLDNFSLADCVIEQNFAEDRTSILQLRGRNHVGDVCLQCRGSIFDLRIRPKKAAHLEATFSGLSRRDVSKPDEGICVLRAPLPGFVTSISVVVGQAVEAGEELCVLEAMKMRNCLNSVRSGIVKVVNVRQGQSVAEGEIIMELE